MEPNNPLSRDVLHEDLQILRYTLAAISEDVRRFSSFSAEAVQRAIQDLDLARNQLEVGDGSPAEGGQILDQHLFASDGNFFDSGIVVVPESLLGRSSAR